ncbi:MAG: ABC transporter ATP-binding protein, partial [Firmicutes bacterium]|nr:ABC transporter ATP-binding protein [Bacillota bacterium]
MNDQTDRTKDHGSLPFFGIPKMMYLVRRFRRDLAVVIISTVVFGVMEVTFPVLQRYALNRFVEGGTLDGLGGFVLAYIVVIAVMAYSGYINCKVCMATELRMNTVMRNDAMAHLQKLSFDYYNTNSVGYIHARVMSDTGHIGETLTWNLNDGIFFSLTVIGSIAVMLSIDPKLTAMILVIVPVISVFYALFQGKLFRLNRQVREINSRITGQFNEGITGAKTIKSLVIEDRIFEDFESETEAIFKKSMEAARLKGVFRAVTGMAASAALAIVLWQGGLIAKEEIGT